MILVVIVPFLSLYLFIHCLGICSSVFMASTRQLHSYQPTPTIHSVARPPFGQFNVQHILSSLSVSFSQGYFFYFVPLRVRRGGQTICWHNQNWCSGRCQLKIMLCSGVLVLPSTCIMYAWVEGWSNIFQFLWFSVALCRRRVKVVVPSHSSWPLIWE